MTDTLNPHARTTPLRRLARSLAIGLVAAGVAAAAVPAEASHRGGPRAMAERLDRIAYQLREVAAIRNPHRQDARIDRLQYRLDRLEAVSERQRGRLARRNDVRIDRLQHRLRRMEHRAERRIDRRGNRWGYRSHSRSGTSAYLGWRY